MKRNLKLFTAALGLLAFGLVGPAQAAVPYVILGFLTITVGNEKEKRGERGFDLGQKKTLTHNRAKSKTKAQVKQDPWQFSYQNGKGQAGNAKGFTILHDQTGSLYLNYALAAPLPGFLPEQQLDMKITVPNKRVETLRAQVLPDQRTIQSLGSPSRELIHALQKGTRMSAEVEGKTLKTSLHKSRISIDALLTSATKQASKSKTTPASTVTLVPSQQAAADGLLPLRQAVDADRPVLWISKLEAMPNEVWINYLTPQAQELQAPKRFVVDTQSDDFKTLNAALTHAANDQSQANKDFGQIAGSDLNDSGLNLIYHGSGSLIFASAEKGSSLYFTLNAVQVVALMQELKILLALP